MGALVFLITDKMRLEELGAKNSSSSKVKTLNDHNLIRNDTYLTEYYDEYELEEEGEVNGTMGLMEDMDEMQRMMYSMKPRCFSMCEPTELFFRQVVAQVQNQNIDGRFYINRERLQNKPLKMT